MSDWQNPISPINFEAFPLPMARARRCCINPMMPCSANECMAWMTVAAGKMPDGSDSQGNCVHVLDKSVAMQKSIREQLQAAMYERDKYVAMSHMQQGQTPPEAPPAKTN
jgi:hypothetical protein